MACYVPVGAITQNLATPYHGNTGSHRRVRKIAQPSQNPRGDRIFPSGENYQATRNATLFALYFNDSPLPRFVSPFGLSAAWRRLKSRIFPEKLSRIIHAGKRRRNGEDEMENRENHVSSFFLRPVRVRSQSYLWLIL